MSYEFDVMERQALKDKIGKWTDTGDAITKDFTLEELQTAKIKDLEHFINLKSNVHKIELAQQILKSVYGIDVNVHLKNAIISAELARQMNHFMLCTTSDRVFK